MIAFWKILPDQKLDNRPYKVFLVDDWMTEPMQGRGGSEIPPTGKAFEVDFYTIGKWHEGQIVEENLMYDLVGFLQQIGLGE